MVIPASPHGLRHSDHGCQHTRYAFAKRRPGDERHPSMGSVGDALNNAKTESFFAARASARNPKRDSGVRVDRRR
jgi:hypothetical protein